MSKQKLELTWIGKNRRPKLEPRIQLEGPSKSYHAGHRVIDNDQFNICVSTQDLSAEHLQGLTEEADSERSLLICCTAFHGIGSEQAADLTVNKIPKMVLARCEWGHDDYSLNVAALPMFDKPTAEPATQTQAVDRKKKAQVAPDQGGLFAVNEA